MRQNTPFQTENLHFLGGDYQTPTGEGTLPPQTSLCIVHSSLLDLVTPLFVILKVTRGDRSCCYSIGITFY